MTPTDGDRRITAAPRIFEPDYYERMQRLEAESWWNAGMRDIAERLLSLAPLPQQGTLLDVGCGSGQSMQWALNLLGPRWKAIGLDIAMNGVEAARAVGLNALHASAMDMPLVSASIDLVITLDVLQHLPLDGGDVIALREMRRVLKTGGTLLVRTNAQSIPHASDDPKFNFRKYDRNALSTALISAGFEVRQLYRFNVLLGLAEIPRELCANRKQLSSGYHGILGKPSTGPAWSKRLKRWWLTVEGRIAEAGLPMPLGRTLIALCVARNGSV